MILQILSTTVRLLIWGGPLAFFIYRDRNGRKPIYEFEIFLRAMFGLAYLFVWVDPKNPDYNLLFWLIVFEFTSFWIFFELVLNIIRKRPWLHYDYVELDSGRIDRGFAWLYRKFKTHLFHHIAKMICFIILILAIIRIYAIH